MIKNENARIEKASNEKSTQYHEPTSCNKCGGERCNDIKQTDHIDCRMSECETTCRKCGHKDYWAYGWFESGQYIESKCKTYE